MKFKETPEDLAVKDRLWCATERELVDLSGRYASGFKVGCRYSGRQREVAAHAKKKGYPVGVLRAVGDEIRRGLYPSEKSTARISDYRAALGI